MEDFLLLHGVCDDSALARGAARLYATFMAANAVRHGRTAAAAEAWVQFVAEVSARGSPLARWVATAWNV